MAHKSKLSLAIFSLKSNPNKLHQILEQKSVVSPDSGVRKIWSQADMILFIFAGSAAEFALNKDVDLSLIHI